MNGQGSQIYFVKNCQCKFKSKCKLNHPKEKANALEAGTDNEGDKKVCVASPASSCSSAAPTADPAFLKDKVNLKNLFHCIRALPALNCSLVFFTDAREETNTQPLTSLRWNKSSEFSRMVKEANHLGMALGIPCLDVLEEAEAQCALDGCSTSDSDAFLFGAGTVYGDFFIGEGGYVICYEMEEIEKELGFGKNSLLEATGSCTSMEMAHLPPVLLGGDYANGVHGFGPSAAIFVSASMETGGLSAPQEAILEPLTGLHDRIQMCLPQDIQPTRSLLCKWKVCAGKLKSDCTRIKKRLGAFVSTDCSSAAATERHC
ncbi:hypothetical protein ACP4OV_029451 [Aristida adscensionis]